VPAQRLDQQSISISQFDVAGRDSATLSEFIRHVGLMPEIVASFAPGTLSRLLHMKPPLETEAEPGSVHVVGSVPPTIDETSAISLFYDEHRNEYAAQSASRLLQYAILPSIQPDRATDGTVIRTRFSCAGFVIGAYREAEIDLIDEDEGTLPPVDLETLVRAYPDQESSLRNPKLRERMNLGGDGPWPVVLPGYVLKSLCRRFEEIKAVAYRPTPGDEFFRMTDNSVAAAKTELTLE